MQEQAKQLFACGFFEQLKNPSQAYAIILAGQDLGLSPMQSLTNLFCQRGKIGVSANFIARRIKESGVYDYKILQNDEAGCRIAIYRDKVFLGEEFFGPEQAKRAGLASSQMYQKYPKNMYFSRCISNLYRWYCPEVLGASGIYTQDELADGNVEVFETDEENPLYQQVMDLWEQYVPDKDLEEYLGKPLTEVSEDQLLKLHAQLMRKKQLADAATQAANEQPEYAGEAVEA